MTKLINAETGITLSVVSVVIGAVAWLTNINSTATASARQIEKLEARQDNVDDNIKTIMINTHELKVRLDFLIDQSRGKK
jgi:hypothetical protein